MHARVTLIATFFALLFGLGLTSHVTSQPDLPSPQATTNTYTEDFTGYAHKAYTDDAVWDIWQGHLRLARNDATDESYPAIASDNGGNLLIVWEDFRNGNRDIYAQKVDGNGNRLWGSDVRVNSDSGTTSQGSPSITSDNDGNLLIVWQDSRNGNDDIYAQKMDGNGNKLWGSDVRVNSDSGADGQFSPAIASDIGGNLLIVWRDDRNNDGDIYTQKLDGNGNKLWGSDVRVNSDSGTSWQYSPAIASDSSGNMLIVWQDNRNDNNDIYAQKVSGNGNKLWGSDVHVNSDSGVTRIYYSPAIASDNGDNLLIVWGAYLNGNYDVYAQKVDGFGNKLWGNEVRVNSDSATNSQYYFSPAIASDSGGNLLIVWEHYRNGDYDIYAQKVDGNGNKLWSGDVRVNSDSGATWQFLPAIANDNGGNLLIVWANARNGDTADIYAQKLDGNGNRLWGSDVRVNSDSGTVGQHSPAIASTNGGNLLIVWGDSRNGNDDIYAQKVDGNGNILWDSDVRVNSDSGTAWQGFPAIASDNGGNLLIVWVDARNGDTADIYAQKLDGNGNRLWGNDVRVSSDSGALRQSYPSIASDNGGNLLIAWMDARNGDWDIYAQKVDGNGNRLWGNDVRVNSDDGIERQFLPAITSDNGGNLLIAWMDYRNSEYSDIYAQKVDGDGNKLWGSDVRVSSYSGTAHQWSPAIASDNSGNLLIVWEDTRSDFAIYAQKVDGNGNRLWGSDMRVNSDSGTPGRGFPSVASDTSGNLLVVWSDDRNNDYNIYAQKLDGNGNKLWGSDVRVNSDSSTANQYSPAIASDIGGNLLIAWVDSRNNNNDIYAQKVNQVGGKGWLADLQVVYPDLFYLPSGIVESRTIDNIPNDIRQATLTTNFQANGGTVALSLTNDGGAHWSTVTPGVTHVFTTTGSDLRWRAILTGDPLWRHRTPLIHSLQIEYSTEMPSGDSYEPDDTCSQARPIQINGAAQQHTFHQPDDSDWAWFDGQAGVTYIIQTSNTGPSADTALELYGQCEQPPIDEEDNAFGPGATLVFATPTTGRYYVRVLQEDGAVFGAGTEYDLSVRTQSTGGAAIIVAGRLYANDFRQPIIEETAAFAYQSLLQGGMSPDNIQYLSNATGRPGVDGLPTKTNVRDAIQDWARTRVGLGTPLWIYLADHGNVDRFHNEVGEVVTAADLNLWLSNLEATSGVDQINVIMDACFSGSFIDTYVVGQWGLSEISSHGRVVVASTTSRWWAYAPGIVPGQPVPLMYFSDGFWNAVGQGQSIWSAFLSGRATVEAAGQLCGDYAYSCQRPWLDDTGDAWFDAADGLVAQTRGLGASFGGGIAPYIDWLTVSAVQDGQATIRVQARDDSEVERVWARLFAPSFEPPETEDGIIPVIEVPEVDLVRESGDVFAVDYDGFTEMGAYQVVVYAEDDEGQVSIPRWILTGQQQVYLPVVVR